MVIKPYSYSDRTESETQYDTAGYGGENIVPAHYIPALVPMDKGNPFIESLPLPRTDDEIKMDYTKTLVSYDYDSVKNMSKLEKMLNVGTLRNIRFPLSFHKSLEFSFYNSLLTSYRSRTLIKSPEDDEPIMCGDSGDSTNAGFSLIGYSGCGKSSALNILLSDSLSIQRFGIMESFIQSIPNTFVQCREVAVRDAVDNQVNALF